MPQSLTDTRTSGAPGTTLSYFGYSVEVPWKTIDRKRNEGRWADVHFKSGETVKFFNPLFFDVDPINRSLVHGEVDFDQAFESGIHESKYEQFKDIVSVKPSDLSPFHSRREFARIKVLLDIKGLWFEHNVAVPQILSFETSGYRGFEISGLAQGWQNVSLTFFENGTNHSYAVLLDGNAPSGLKLEQADVNRVIQSFSVVSSR